MFELPVVPAFFDVDLNNSILASSFFHFCTLLVGILLCYMGYRLFTLGIAESAGDAQGKWGKGSIVLKRAAPGTFFGLFGAVVIGVAILHPFSVDLKTSQAAQERKLNSFRPSDESTVSISEPIIVTVLPPPDIRRILRNVSHDRPVLKEEREKIDEWLADAQVQSERSKQELIQRETRVQGLPPARVPDISPLH